MIIKKIEVIGQSKPTATLIFEKGLNVIAGASDTGKSYVIQCIKFILGSSNLPKNIDEANGYEFLKVTFEENGRTFTLQRKLEVKSPILAKEEGHEEVIVLQGKHRNGFDNISNWFLNKFNLSDKLLLIGKEKLNTQSLSLRTLEKIFIVDETRIVADYSPLGTGQNGERTLEMSLLRCLLTGEDDTNAKEIKVDLESNQAINKKIVALESIIQTLYPQQTPEETYESIRTQIEKLDGDLNEIDVEVSQSVSLSKDFLQKRSNLASELTKLETLNDEDRSLYNRFHLLRNKYKSDCERLDAIQETSLAFDAYTEMACPTCGNMFEYIQTDDEIGDLRLSAISESNKISRQIDDLSEAILNLESNIETEYSRIVQVKKEIDSINLAIAGDLKTTIDLANERKSNIYSQKFLLTKQNLQLENKEKALKELGTLMMRLDEKQSTYTSTTLESELKIFETEISIILERWGFPGQRLVQFSEKDRDIYVGGKPRGHFGKGYRAIAFSAFVIALMVQLSKINRHPGFVVLDSPLTTYKKADQDRGDINESIQEDMVYSFYRDLSDFYHELQIIVFDNQEPDKDLIKNINYVHFSKNSNSGRYGFFPNI